VCRSCCCWISRGEVIDEGVAAERHVEKPIPGRRIVDVVTPERRMSACLPSGKGLELVAVMFVSVLKWWMSVASMSLCDFLPWFALRQSVTRW
jgi:hypothetical protein